MICTLFSGVTTPETAMGITMELPREGGVRHAHLLLALVM